MGGTAMSKPGSPEGGIRTPRAPQQPLCITSTEFIEPQQVDILLDERFWNSWDVNTVVKDTSGQELFKIEGMTAANQIIRSLSDEAILLIKASEIWSAGMSPKKICSISATKLTLGQEIVATFDEAQTKLHMKGEGNSMYVYLGPASEVNLPISRIMVIPKSGKQAHDTFLVQVAPMVDLCLITALVLSFDDMYRGNRQHSEAATKTRQEMRRNSRRSSVGGSISPIRMSSPTRTDRSSLSSPLSAIREPSTSVASSIASVASKLVNTPARPMQNTLPSTISANA